MYSPNGPPLASIPNVQLQQQQQAVAPQVGQLPEEKKWPTVPITPYRTSSVNPAGMDDASSIINSYHQPMQYPYYYSPYGSPASAQHYNINPSSFNFPMQQSMYNCPPATPFLLPSSMPTPPYYPTPSHTAMSFANPFITPSPSLSSAGSSPAISNSSHSSIGSTPSIPVLSLLTPPSSSSLQPASSSTDSPSPSADSQEKELLDSMAHKKPANLWCQICMMDIRKNRKRSQGPRRHILQFHLKRPIYFCPYDGCKFSSHYDKFHVSSHMSRIHKNMPPMKIREEVTFYEHQIDQLFSACFHHPLNSLVGAEMRKLHEMHEQAMAQKRKAEAEEDKENKRQKTD
ncbi:hypothetical protein WR25_07648 [Diploscapter pachys]|uniref:Uncharacterized protein n=1 Tax=Diploscapter pachys TaxID=2018661 RepID=A0A2A2LVL0_9BILA|nr:hypothetical protein WR25_07648 [Diploscapter pachys]